MTRQRTAALAAALVALLAAAGCGGSQAFIEDYNDATEPFPQLGVDVSRAITDAATAKAGAQQDLETAVTGMEAVVADLRSLDPPDEAQDEFDELIAATDAWIGEIRSLGTLLRSESRDPAKLVAAAQQAVDGARRAQEAEQALRVAVEG
jgi:hypothetical protein